VRRHREERVLVVANLSGTAQSVDLALDAYAGAQPHELLGGTTCQRIGADPYSVTLGPYECSWLLLSGPVIRPSPSFEVRAGVLGTQFEETEAPATPAGESS
jgi:hypothetical protein